LAPGEELEISLGVADIDLGDDGINTIEGSLEYDNNIFEEVKTANITNLNGWAFTYNDEDSDLNGKFLGILLNSGVKTETSIAKVKMKVKENVKDQNTVIRIKNITTNDGKELIKDVDKEINVKIEKKQNNSNDNDKINSPVTSGNSNTNYKGDKLPKTGIDYISLSVAIIIMLGIGIISFIKYRKNR